MSEKFIFHTPKDFRWFFGPIPEVINICGELIVPAERSTSFFAIITCFLFSRTNDMPTAFLS